MEDDFSEFECPKAKAHKLLIALTKLLAKKAVHEKYKTEQRWLLNEHDKPSGVINEKP